MDPAPARVGKARTPPRAPTRTTSPYTHRNLQCAGSSFVGADSLVRVGVEARLAHVVHRVSQPVSGRLEYSGGQTEACAAQFNPAIATVEYPSELTTGKPGRWAWNTVFKETVERPATRSSGQGRISLHLWGSDSSLNTVRTVIKRSEVVADGGTGKDSYWVGNVDDFFCNRGLRSSHGQVRTRAAIQSSSSSTSISSACRGSSPFGRPFFLPGVQATTLRGGSFPVGAENLVEED